MTTKQITLAAVLTANAAKFASTMRAASGSLDAIRARVISTNRIMRVGFSAFALRGFVGSLMRAARVAEELGVNIGDVDRARLSNLRAAFDRWRASAAKLVLELGARLAPAMTSLLDRAAAAVEMFNSWLTPATIRNVAWAAKWAVGLYAAAKAARAFIFVLELWRQREKALAAALVIRQALSGPAGWAVLAASAAVAVGAVYALEKAFESGGKTGAASVGKIGDSIDRLNRKLQAGVGRRGIDFIGADRREYIARSVLGASMARVGVNIGAPPLSRENSEWFSSQRRQTELLKAQTDIMRREDARRASSGLYNHEYGLNWARW